MRHGERITQQTARVGMKVRAQLHPKYTWIKWKERDKKWVWRKGKIARVWKVANYLLIHCKGLDGWDNVLIDPESRKVYKQL